MKLSWEASAALAVAFSMLIAAIRLYLTKHGDQSTPVRPASHVMYSDE